MAHKPALARYLFIIQNSSDQFTVHSLQFIVRIKNVLTDNRGLSTVNFSRQSSAVSCKLLPPGVVRYALLMPIMKAVELQGEIDDQHRLHANVPQSLPTGSVRVIIFMPEEDEAGLAWAAGVSSEWSAELNDPAQDTYTLNDGQPIDAPR